MIKFSLVIPVYNKEKCLRDTLNSVVDNHNIPDNEFECILVNESSTDNSGLICNEYSDKYSYFKTYTILNDGVHRPTHARNFGKTIANGKYIMFLDADDLLCSGFMSETIKFLDEHNEYDFYLCNRYVNGQYLWPIVEQFELYGPILSCCIFRKTVTDSLDFENIYCEDIMYTLKIKCSNYKYYYNLSNPASYEYNLDTLETSKIDNKVADEYRDLIGEKSGWITPIIKMMQYSTNYNICLNKNEDFVIDKRKKPLQNIEIYLVDYCNLNCAYCANFSTINKNRKPIPIEYIINELKNIQRYQDDLKRITLLGGEPMLHPKLGAIFEIVREMFPNIEIVMITNGTLYKRLYKLRDSIIRNNISVSVSVYPVDNKSDIIYAFKNLIPGYLLSFNFQPIEFGFYTKHLMADYHNEWDKIYHCILRNSCCRLDGNRIYLCEYASNIDVLKDYYPNEDIKLNNEGAYIELNENVSAYDIANFLYNAVPDLCHHCATVLQENPDLNFKLWDAVEWHPTKKELSEFYIK